MAAVDQRPATLGTSEVEPALTEPVVPRVDARRRSAFVVPAVVAVVLLVLLAVVWALTGVDPWSAVTTFWSGAFGGRAELAATVNRAIPLTIVGLGAALALRGGVFNVGGEGQMSVGGLTAAVVVVAVGSHVPAGVSWLLAVAAGAVGGAAWALLPALLAARRNVSEILSTLLLNFVTASLLLWVLELGPVADPDPNVITPQGKPIPPRAELPVLESASRLHAGLFLAILLVAVTAWFFRTPAGLRVDITGANSVLAAQAGVRPVRLRAALLLTSAGIAGVAGAVQLLGVTHRMTTGLAGGIGYTGVLVAVLARSRPLAVVGAAVAFASVLTGGAALEFDGVPRSVVVFVQAVVVVAAATTGRARR